MSLRFVANHQRPHLSVNVKQLIPSGVCSTRLILFAAFYDFVNMYAAMKLLEEIPRPTTVWMYETLQIHVVNRDFNYLHLNR